MTKKELVILKTDEDKTGFEVDKMSDFIDNYFHYSIQNISENTNPVSLDFIGKENLNVVSGTIIGAIRQLKDGTTFIPDFDHLPFDIKEKLKKGIYKLGESRQVDGNYRPVILDENGTRVKDVTLKKVIASKDATLDLYNIQLQIQLKKINDSLERIEVLQMYQITRERDNAVLVPFLDARDYILKAQISESENEQKEYLIKASELLDHAFNETAKELDTNKNFLIKESHKIFKKQGSIDVFIEFMSQDVQLLTQITGIQMHIHTFLKEEKKTQLAYEKYKNFMISFANDRKNKLGMSGFELMHDNCCYKDGNKDSWYNFSNLLTSSLKSKGKLENKEYVLVGVEENGNKK